MDSNDSVFDDGEHMPITESIASANEIFFKTLETNELSNGLEALEPYVNKSIYHSALKAMIHMLVAVTTFEKADIEEAAKAVEKMTKLSNKYRRTGFFLSVMKMVKTPNYKKYSDLELHAELIHAYSIAMNAIIHAINTFNIYGLIKVVYRMQKFIKNFQTCKIINKMEIEWESDISRINFEAGVRFSNGLCHLAISNIPPKLLRIVNFLGYQGIESVGWTQINKSAAMDGGMNSQFARAFLLGYWLYVEPHGCLGPVNLDVCLELLNKEMEKYPHSLIFIGGLAKYQQITGNIDNAIEVYEYLIRKSDRRAHKAFYMELLFIYALKCDWDQCIHYGELARKESGHSPALSAYIEAVFRYVKSIDDSDPDMKQKATELFEKVPSLRIRHLGKTITPEKVAVVKSEKFKKQDDYLNLPEVELLYQFNYLLFIKDNPVLLNKLLDRIEAQETRLKHDIEESAFLDNYLQTHFFKGVILKLKGQLNDAKECFKNVLEDESRIESEFSVPPQAVLELGLTELEQGNHEEAEKWLNKCINDYHGYLNENYVIIRAYAGLRLLGVSTDKEKEDELKKKEYTKEWLKDLNVKQENYIQIIVEEDKTLEAA